MVNAVDFARRESEAEQRRVEQYQRRRRWSRTDSARWLNDRSPAILAWLRRGPGDWPHRTDEAGYWLKEKKPSLFDAAHNRLAHESTDSARDALHVGDLL